MPVPTYFERAAALGAVLVQPLRVPAVVAHEPAAEAVVGQAHAAIGAAVREAAVHAGYELVCAASVQEEYALLAALQVFRYLGAQSLAYAAAVAAAELALHVDDLDAGHGLLIESP